MNVSVSSGRFGNGSLAPVPTNPSFSYAAIAAGLAAFTPTSS